MLRTPTRLYAWFLLAGAVLATGGYLAAFLANGNGDARFSGSSWTALYTVALFGDVLVILGLPALVTMHGDRSRTLTLIGYVGVMVPMVVLNVGEGAIEAFVKPYFATHGGLLDHDLPGLAAYEAPALLVLLVGMICLAVATFRAGVLPRWVAAVFFAVPLLGAAGLSGGISLLPDYLLFIALSVVGVQALRSGRRVEAATSAVAVPHPHQNEAAITT